MDRPVARFRSEGKAGRRGWDGQRRCNEAVPRLKLLEHPVSRRFDWPKGWLAERVRHHRSDRDMVRQCLPPGRAIKASLQPAATSHRI